MNQLRPLLSGDALMPGVTTRAIPGQCVMLEDGTTGQSAVIGRFNSAIRGTGNQMEPLEEGFAELGIPALRRLAASAGDWAFVDEIGYLESGCPAYQGALEELLARKSVLAVLRKQDTPLIERLKSREDVFLYDLDRPLPTLGCILMASGQGQRFGGNKLLAAFHGQPLIRQILSATDTAFFSRRIVVTRSPEVAALCHSMGVEAVLHDQPYRNDTVRIGLESLSVPLPDGCMFCPCDQPLLSKDTLETMACAFIGQSERIHRLSWQGAPGSPIIFPRRCYPALKSLPQGKGGSYVARSSGEQVLLVEAPSAWELKDVDTPEDLQTLENKSAAT